MSRVVPQRAVNGDVPDDLNRRLGAGGPVRFRDDKPGDLRARVAVAAWLRRNPDGTGSDLIAAHGGQRHPDYAPVLRAVLFTADRDQARVITGITTARAGAAR